MNKKLLRLLSVLLLSIYFITGHAEKAVAQDGNEQVTYQTFYDNLSPYGQWIDDAQYGYVFAPQVTADFRPYYTDGHWVMTDYGNTWVSDYPWGWACFHYGRWTYDTYYGWLWIPGNQWGPSWVSWRYGDNNYGWAPLGPDYVDGMDYGSYYCPSDWWIFLPSQYLYKRHYYHYWSGLRDNDYIVHHTSVVNNNGSEFIGGPRASDVEHITHQPVQVYHVNSVADPRASSVSGSTVSIYHPMSVRPNAGGIARPASVVRANQAITSRPQPVSSNNGQPAYRNEIKADPASNLPVQTRTPQEQPAQQQAKPYEWDVNRSQPQTVRPADVTPAPQPVQNIRQAPPPQQNFSRPALQQNYSRPAPATQQNFSRPAPAPQQNVSRPSAPAPSSGGRR